MKKTILFGCILSVMVAIDVPFTYGDDCTYTDENGAIYFTIDCKKVPSKYKAIPLTEESSHLSKKQFQLLKTLLKSEPTETVQFSSMEELTKSLWAYSELLKRELDDPEQLVQTKDPRLATPEGALSLYRSALKNGNVKDLQAATTSRLWEQEAPLADQNTMAKREKRLFDDTKVVAIEKEDNAAKYVLAKTNGSNLQLTFYLVNAFGNWKILDVSGKLIKSDTGQIAQPER